MQWTRDADGPATAIVVDTANRAPDDLDSASLSLGVAQLLNVFEGDAHAVADFLNAALASIRRDSSRLDRTIADRDAQATIETAHRIKGTGGSIGAVRKSARRSNARRRPNHPIFPTFRSRRCAMC